MDVQKYLTHDLGHMQKAMACVIKAAIAERCATSRWKRLRNGTLPTIKQLMPRHRKCAYHRYGIQSLYTLVTVVKYTMTSMDRELACMQTVGLATDGLHIEDMMAVGVHESGVCRVNSISSRSSRRLLTCLEKHGMRSSSRKALKL